jgi:hypothetical protein
VADESKKFDDRTRAVYAACVPPKALPPGF